MSLLEPYSFDPWIPSVTRICTLSHGKAAKPCIVSFATGFFYKKNESKYLITNRHVVIQEEKHYYPDSLEIRVHKSKIAWENKAIIIPLYNNEGKPQWLEHSNKEVDVIAIDMNSYLTSPIFITYWSSDFFLPRDEILPLGRSILIIGSPMAFYDEFHNFPITKSGTLASPYRIHFNRCPYFLLDADIPNGMSGSPVVLPIRTEKYTKIKPERGVFLHKLLGILSCKDPAIRLSYVWYPSLIEDIISQ